MTLAGGLGRNPIRTLVWMEVVAALLAFAADAFLVFAASRSETMARVVTEFALAALFSATAAATFAIPHAPNRRFIQAAVSIVGITALSWLPPHGKISPIVLLAVLAVRLTFAFGPRGATVAWAATLIAFLASIAAQISGASLASELPSVVHALFAYALMLGLMYGMIAVMWVYANKSALTAASSERARIAMDLHDSLGHALTALNVQLQNAERFRTIDASKANSYLSSAMHSASELLTDVRDMVSILHDDSEPEAKPLQTLLERLLRDYSSTYDTRLRYTINLKQEPSGRIAIALYRVTQEALTNVARHARARNLQMTAHGDEKQIEITLSDDGRGFSKDAAGGHGLLSMRSRIESVNGAFSVASEPGRGTTVHVKVPLELGA